MSACNLSVVFPAVLHDLPVSQVAVSVNRRSHAFPSLPHLMPTERTEKKRRKKLRVRETEEKDASTFLLPVHCLKMRAVASIKPEIGSEHLVGVCSLLFVFR